MTMAAEGGAQQKSGPNWLLIGGIAVVGVIILMFVGKSGGGGGGTTAAGTSINAALGSIQEEALNIMGQLGQARTDILSQGTTNTNTILASMTAFETAISQQMQGMEDALSGELDAVNQSIVAGNASNATGFKTLSDQAADNLTTMLNEVRQSSGGLSTQIQSLQANLTAAREQQNQMYQALSGQMTNLTSAQAAGFQGVNQTVIDAEKALYAALNPQLGTLLDWTDEIKARLQQGDYSAARWGPSSQPWATVSQY